MHVATLNLDEVSAARANLTRTKLTLEANHSKKIYVDFDACDPSKIFNLSVPVQVKYHIPEEEIALGPSCWLWDYL